MALVGLACLAFVLGACAGGSPGGSPTLTSAGRSPAPHLTTSGSGSGNGPVIRPGSHAGSGSGDKETAGGYSVAFAACMRVHGVPGFPDPDANAGLPGADGRVNPASPAYQAALHGPCESLAPVGWLSSGPVTK